MSGALTRIQEKISQTQLLLSEAEEVMAEGEDAFSLGISASSLKSQLEDLEQEFREIALNKGHTVCTYTVWDTNRRFFRAGPGLQSAAGFQTLYSTVFEALQHGPRKRSIISADTREHTSFGFAYGFAGSLGLVLTLPPALFTSWEDSAQSDAIRKLFGLLELSTPDDIRTTARTLGRPVVREMLKWANVHADEGYGATIKWSSGDQTIEKMIAPPQMKALTVAILTTTDAEVTLEQHYGKLVGVDLPSKRFHFVTKDKLDIKGTFRDAIGPQREVELPGPPCMAAFEKSTVYEYASDREVEDYVLLEVYPR